MKQSNRGMVKQCGDDLARPYVNNQTFEKMYDLSTALENGTIFPELYLLDSSYYNKDLYKAPNKKEGEDINEKSN